MPNLEQLRCDIDKIDEQIVYLLIQRFRNTKEIGLYKKEHNLNICDDARWCQVCKHLEDHVNRFSDSDEVDLNEELIGAIYNIIHKHSKDRQK